CVFSPEGDVILHDPGTHRTYRLTSSVSAAAETPPRAPEPQVPHQEQEDEALLLQNRAEGEPSRPMDSVTWELFTNRNEEPTPENPLHYRERSYVAAGGVSPDEAE